MIPEVFEWDGHGPMSILAEHAHVHRDGKCVKNRFAVACDVPRASVLGEFSPITAERVNHVAEAKRVMTDGEHAVGRARDAAANGNHRVADGYGAKAHGCWMQAQVHATLALVEQQRIANVIALGQFRVAPGDVAHFRHVVAQPKDEFTLQVSPQIAEALGLS